MQLNKVKLWIEGDKLDSFAIDNGIGLAVYCPLHQGLLTDKYLKEIPTNSRIGKNDTNIGKLLTPQMIEKLNMLNTIAANRGQTLAQMALSWILKNKAVTTVLIGASRPEQIKENVSCIEKLDFTNEENIALEALLL